MEFYFTTSIDDDEWMTAIPEPCPGLVKRTLTEETRCELCMKPGGFTVDDINKLCADQERKVYEYDENKKVCKAKHTAMQEKIQAKLEDSEPEDIEPELQMLRENMAELQKYLQKQLKAAKKDATG